MTAAAAPLEVADDPCFVLLSSTGLLARTADAEPPGDGGGRANHDVVVSAVAHDRARRGRRASPSRGRLVKLGVLDLPALPATANDPNLQGGAPLSEFVAARARRAGARADLAAPPTAPASRSAPRTASSSGSTPRCSARDDWEVIRLEDGDEVVGAVELATGDEDARASSPPTPSCCTSPPTAVRPQGRSGGGIAGVRLAAGERVVFVRRRRPGDDAGRRHRLRLLDRAARHRAGRGQGHAVRRVPRQGPGHRRRPLPPLPQGRGHPVLAWAGAAPARAAAASGAPSTCPRPTGRRDGSGMPGSQPIAACRRPARSRPARRRPAPTACGRLTPCSLAPHAARSPPRRRLVLALPALSAGSAAATTERRRRRTQTPRRCWPRRRRPSTRPAASSSPLDHRRPARRRHRHQRPTGIGTHAPAFEGTINVVLSGQAVDVPVIAVDGKVYAKLPLTPGLARIDPADYGAPDPAQLIDRRRGLLRAARQPTEPSRTGDSVRGGADNNEILTDYTGTIPGDAVKTSSRRADGRLRRRPTPSPTTTSCARPSSPAPSTATADDDDLHRRPSTTTAPRRTSPRRERRHGDAAPRAAAAAARPWRPSRWRSPRPTPTSSCWRCPT